MSLSWTSDQYDVDDDYGDAISQHANCLTHDWRKTRADLDSRPCWSLDPLVRDEYRTYPSEREDWQSTLEYVLERLRETLANLQISYRLVIAADRTQSPKIVSCISDAREYVTVIEVERSSGSTFMLERIDWYPSSQSEPDSTVHTALLPTDTKSLEKLIQSLDSMVSNDPGMMQYALWTTFPWAAFLTEQGRATFAYELTQAMRTSIGDDVESIVQLVREWAASARILADPELTRRLTEPLEANGGTVPVPPG